VGDDDSDCPDEVVTPSVSDYGSLTDGYFVATGNCISSNAFSAKVLGCVNLDVLKEASADYSFGVVFSDSHTTPTVSDGYVVADELTDLFTVSLSGLKAGTTYYYRACAIVNGNNYYAKDVCSFTTPTLSLELGEVSNVTDNSVSITGHFDSTALLGLNFKVGVLVSTNDVPTYANGNVSFSPDIDGNSFLVNLDNLQVSTKYYYRVCLLLNNTLYVSNGIGSFVTNELDLTTGSVTDVTAFSATFTGTMNSSTIADYEGGTVGVIVSENSDPSISNGTQLPATLDDGNSFSVVCDKLSPHTTYYFRTYAILGDAVYYSVDAKSFTTSNVIFVDTQATSVQPFTATLASSIQTGGTPTGDYAVGFLVSSIKNVELSNSKVVECSNVDDFSATINELKANSTYYFRPYLKYNNKYYISGSTSEFTTTTFSIQTGSYANVTALRATLNGTVDLQQLTNCTYSAGAVVSTDANPGANNGYTFLIGALSSDNYNVKASNLSGDTQYYYRACVKVAVNDYTGNSSETYHVLYLGNIKDFTTTASYPSGAVDLGLSSGTKWASCNLGASSPEQYGSYYAWGETSTKSTYEVNAIYNLSPDELRARGVIDSNNNLTSTYDAATAALGSGWHIPTYAEVYELQSECKWVPTTYKDVSGYRVIGSNDNSIFLPFAGYMNLSELVNGGSYGEYWTATTTAYGPYNLDIRSYNIDFAAGAYWWMGHSIRPVK
jgi:hypothetical protein